LRTSTQAADRAVRTEDPDTARFRLPAGNNGR
jgi:hypothetical protein